MPHQNLKQMESTTKQKTPKKLKGMPERKGSDLSKIFGIGKGKIFYDDSIFNLGKRRERVCNGIS